MSHGLFSTKSGEELTWCYKMQFSFTLNKFLYKIIVDFQHAMRISLC